MDLTPVQGKVDPLQDLLVADPGVQVLYFK